MKKNFAAITEFRRSQDGLEDELNKVFGNANLSDIKPSEKITLAMLLDSVRSYFSHFLLV